MKNSSHFGTEFEAQSSDKGFFGEFCEFLLHNKKYWMLPIVVALLIVGLLIFLSSSAAAPFVYTLF